MGACGSKQRKPAKNTVNNNGVKQGCTDNSKRYQDEHKNNLNQVAVNWKPNTIGIWKRSYDKLAIHTDIPRLGHKIEIIDKLDRLSPITFTNVTSISLNNTNGSSNNLMATGSTAASGESPVYIQNGASSLSEQQQQQSQSQSTQQNNTNENNNNEQQQSNNNNEQQPINKNHQLLENKSKYTSLTTLTQTGFTTSQVLKKEEVVYQVLTSLAHLLDGPEKERMIKDQFSNYIKGNGDMSQQLLGLLGSEAVGEHSKLMSLLKVCHQKIILPGYYFIKANLFEDLPFRDKRGSWRMRITFEEDGTVMATHSKRQQSTAGSESDPEFEFEWCLSIIFDKEMMISNLRVEVVDLIISKNLTNEKKQEIQHAFSVLQNATNTTNSNSNSEPIPLNKV
eukprot:gene6643-8219_t